MKTFLGRLIIAAILLFSFARLENPIAAVIFGGLVSWLILWFGAENAIRSFEYKKCLGSANLRVEVGAANLYASLLITSLVFELGVRPYWGTTNVLGILFTLLTFVSLWWGFGTYVKHLAREKCPDIEFA